MHDCGASVLGQCNSPPRGRHAHRYRSDLLQVIHPILRPAQNNHRVNTHTLLERKQSLKNDADGPPPHVFSPHLSMNTSAVPPPTNPIFISHPNLPCRLRGHDRTGEDKLQPLRPGYLPCFHLHRQLISHHWRALARQAEDFIRDVLYGP